MNLEVNILGVKFKNPLLPAAGPLVMDPVHIKRLVDLGIGGIVTKTISDKKAVVSKPAIAKIEDGILNCELWSEDPPEKWFDDYFPKIKEFNLPVIISAGYTPEQLEKIIPKSDPFADMFEISTHYLGQSPDPVYNAAKKMKELTKKPVFIKLSPHVPDIGEFAKAAISGGADGIVAINSVGPTLHIDIKRRKSPLGSADGYGWLSGPAIKSIALRAVHEIRKAVGDNIPIFGVGGIKSAEDVVEFMMAGANATQMLSAAMMYGIELYKKIIDDLPHVLESIGVDDINNVINAYK